MPKWQRRKVAVVHHGTRGVHPLFARYPHSLSRHGPVSQSALQNAILHRIKMQLHPGRLTWNLQITHLKRKMIFQTSMIMVHVNLPGCTLEVNQPPFSKMVVPNLEDVSNPYEKNMVVRKPTKNGWPRTSRDYILDLPTLLSNSHHQYVLIF